MGPEMLPNCNGMEWRIELSILANHTLFYKYMCISPWTFQVCFQPETGGSIQMRIAYPTLFLLNIQ